MAHNAQHPNLLPGESFGMAGIPLLHERVPLTA